MNKLKLAIVTFIGVVCFVQIVHLASVNAGLRHDLETSNVQLLQNEQIVQINETTIERQAQELRNERRLSKALSDSLPELEQRINDLNRDIHSWSTLAARYKAILDSGEAVVEPQPSGEPPQLSMRVTEEWGTANLLASVVDSTIHGSTSLEVTTRGVRIRYWLNSRTRDYYLDIQHDPMALHVVLSEDSTGNWVADWSVPNFLDIENISTILVPYKRPWWDKVTITMGATTAPSFLIGGGFNGWTLGMMMDVKRHYYLTKTFSIHRLFSRRR